MSRKNFILFLLLLTTNFIETKVNPIIEISIPKSGTHLLASCLNMLTYKNMKDLNTNLNNLKTLKDTSFFHSHFEYNDANINLIRSLRPVGFFILRDPRDQIISLMHWIYRFPDSYQNYFYLNPDELLCKLIRETKNLYLNYLGWMKEPNFITIRFEDLVGSNGGGNRKKQINTILCIARHIKFFCSEYRAESITQNLFGNSPTFREGKIGSWKNYFTKKHKRLFKNKCGQLLIDLKYEKDFNW